jgi:hypothetical protein
MKKGYGTTLADANSNKVEGKCHSIPRKFSCKRVMLSKYSSDNKLQFQTLILLDENPNMFGLYFCFG